MTSKHTPGPWTFELDRDVDQGHFDIRDSEGNRVAEVRNDFCDYYNAVAYWLSDDCPMEANAALIAEAPAMLEALRGMVCHLGPRVGSKFQREALNKAKAILSRIGGEE